MIEFDNITFIYDNKPLMQHFSCCISSGEKVVLYGPSGHGKSTLLASVAGFVLPDEGSIRINGKIPRQRCHTTNTTDNRMVAPRVHSSV